MSVCHSLKGGWGQKSSQCLDSKFVTRRAASDLELSKTSQHATRAGLRLTTVFMSIWLSLTCMEMSCILSNCYVLICFICLFALIFLFVLYVCLRQQ